MSVEEVILLYDLHLRSLTGRQLCERKADMISMMLKTSLFYYHYYLSLILALSNSAFDQLNEACGTIQGTILQLYTHVNDMQF